MLKKILFMFSFLILFEGCGTGINSPELMETPYNIRACRLDDSVSIDTLQEAEVRSIVDGDTISVDINGTTKYINLLGIQAFESTESILCEQQASEFKLSSNEIMQRGVLSKAYFEALLPVGSIVYLEYDVVPNDDNGNLLAYIWLDDKLLVNFELVRDGYAIAKNDGYNTKHGYKRSEVCAHYYAYGIWNKTVGDLNALDCSVNTSCSELTCNTAKQLLEVCGASNLDPDDDGVPCERACVAQNERIAVVEEYLNDYYAKYVASPANTASGTASNTVATASNSTTSNNSISNNGAALYIKCVACHGSSGEKNALGTSAVLQGMSQNEVVAALKAYRAGTLNQYGMGALMKGQVATYSDSDINAIASYIAQF